MTTQQELETLIRQGESETVEFKETFDADATEAVAAFANTRGGTLLVGVRDDGTIRGITLGKETLRDWANQIAQATGIHPRLNPVSHADGTLVLIEVAESPVKPVACRGRFFKRVGKSTRQMTDDDITRAVLDKLGMTWDEVVEPRASMKDIDPEQTRRFRSLCNHKGRRRIPDDEDDATMLRKLGLLNEGRLLRAALLLFGKNPQRFYGPALVKIGRFRSETHIVDDREIRGTLFDQVEETIQYFRERLQTEFVMTGRPARDVIWEYPLEALREAVTNAVCHRDYLIAGHTQVRWYDDKIVIANFGTLPPPLRMEDLKGPHPSAPRNHKIAEMFFYTGWIEQWGSGIGKMIGECRSAGLPEPEFEERVGGFWVTFRKDSLTEEQLRENGLNERQIQALLHLKEKRRLTNTEYQRLFGVSKRTATDDLNQMESKELVERVGTTGRGTYYQRKKGAKGATKGQ